MSPRPTMAALLPGPDRSMAMPEGTYVLHERLDGQWIVTRPDGTDSSETYSDRFGASLAVVQRVA